MSVILQRLAVNISAHAWNGDRTKVAVCPNTNEIQIYARKGSEFVLETTLAEHDSVVTGLDWGAKTNRIVSCSHDRNAYVWTFDAKQNKWQQMLVILRLDRGATCVAWSPKEDKFAVGSGAKAIAVCYFETENNWWVSKHIKENINSTITCLGWHPNNVLLAAGGTDNVTRVYSAFVRGLDKREDFASGTPFGDKLPFATLLAEFPVSSWVHALSWSPSGNQLAWSTHDSYIYFLECSTKNHQLTSCKYPKLPFRDILFLDENRLLGVGHDCAPMLFSTTSGPTGFAFERTLDEGNAGAAKQSSIKGKWEDLTSKGIQDGEANTTELTTKHQNQIVEVRRINPTMFSTVGIDGNLAVWPFAAVKL